MGSVELFAGVKSEFQGEGHVYSLCGASVGSMVAWKATQILL